MAINYEVLENIKRLTIIALVSDDNLLDKLVLKGGNAISFIHKLSSRASQDIDMSMKTDFKPEELEEIKATIKSSLEDTFAAEGFKIIDFSFIEKPGKMDPSVRHFWGGYDLSFKVLNLSEYSETEGIDGLRRRAIPVKENNSTKYEIDISKYEFVDPKVQYEIDGYSLYAYSPEMIICEKLRAICQQVEEYHKITKRASAKMSSRARDFFDIHTLITHFKVNLTTEKNIELLKNMFAAKKVPMNYLKKIIEYKALHEESFPAVKDTISNKEELKDFNFYFDYIQELIDKINEKL